MDSRSLLVELLAAGEALTRGHSPVCVCADCAATRAAVRGGAAMVERAAVARDALRARRRASSARVEVSCNELPAPRGRAFVAASALGVRSDKVSEVAVVVVARPPWEE